MKIRILLAGIGLLCLASAARAGSISFGSGTTSSSAHFDFDLASPPMSRAPLFDGKQWIGLALSWDTVGEVLRFDWTPHAPGTPDNFAPWSSPITHYLNVVTDQPDFFVHQNTFSDSLLIGDTQYTFGVVYRWYWNGDVVSSASVYRSLSINNAPPPPVPDAGGTATLLACCAALGLLRTRLHRMPPNPVAANIRLP
jgi:hypothetical protein